MAKYDIKYYRFMEREKEFFMALMDRPALLKILKELLEYVESVEKGELSEGQGNMSR